MSRKKLAVVKHYQLESAKNENSGADVISIVFNRPLHSLEAMGIVLLVEQWLKNAAA